jgi:hypothetical protein
MSTKTPFELRYDLLRLAKDTLQDTYYSKLDVYKYNNEIYRGVAATKRLPNDYPTIPTKEEIFALAAEFKGFVEDNRK